MPHMVLLSRSRLACSVCINATSPGPCTLCSCSPFCLAVRIDQVECLIVLWRFLLAVNAFCIHSPARHSPPAPDAAGCAPRGCKQHEAVSQRAHACWAAHKIGDLLFVLHIPASFRTVGLPFRPLNIGRAKLFDNACRLVPSHAERQRPFRCEREGVWLLLSRLASSCSILWWQRF